MTTSACSTPTSSAKLLLLLLASISSGAQLAHSMASGAPAIACANLRPLHGFHLAKPASASQFFVSQSALSFKPGDNITVEVMTHSDERHFRGFIVQAYDPRTGAQIGHFAADDHSQPVDACSAATHRNSQEKRRASITWMSGGPSNSSAVNHLVRFRGSIVVSYEEFYTGFESSDAKFDRFAFANEKPPHSS